MSQPIPRPRGLPLLGNVLDVNPNNTWASLKTLMEKHGEICRITVLGHTIVFVGSVALADELCDEKRFRKFVGGPIVEIRYAVHDALFTAFDHEASWGIAHRIIAPHLTTSAVARHFDSVRATTQQLVDRWFELGPKNNKLVLVNDLNRLNLEATTLILFGNKLNCLEGPEHPMIQAMEDSTSEAMKRPTRPGFLNWLLHAAKFRKSTATMRKYAAEQVDHRKANPTDKQDLMNALLGAKDSETGIALTESQVIDEIVSMPIGSSTAPALVATAIYFLLKNPQCVAKARVELDSVVGNAPLTHAHLASLPYIEGIMRESLRLSFAAPGFNIEPIPSDDKTPIKLAGGKYEIAHDQAVIIVLAGVNRDPAVFEDPLAFKPERMMGKAFDTLPEGAKKWFGSGKRQCIGRHYAVQWNLGVLAMLIKDVDFAMVDQTYDLEQDGWFNLRPVGFRVEVKPRADS